jgi:hypothetical protein
LSATLEAFNWEILDAVGRLTDNRRTGAAEVLRIVREALAADEYVVPLAPALKEAQSKAVRLLTQPPPPPPVVPPIVPPIVLPLPDPPPPVPPVVITPKTVEHGEKVGLTLAAVQDQLERLKKEETAGRRVTVNMSWKIEAGGAT